MHFTHVCLSKNFEKAKICFLLTNDVFVEIVLMVIIEENKFNDLKEWQYIYVPI